MTKNNVGFLATVVRHKGGSWKYYEVVAISSKLATVVDENPYHPEYIILLGHFTEDEVYNALGGGKAFTCTQITDVNSADLPFRPDFA